MSGLRRVEQVMGTAISLELAGDLPYPKLSLLADEVCRLDRGELRVEDCAADVRWVLDRCAWLWRETDGYFDADATGRLDPPGYVKGWAVQVASDRLLGAGLADHCINAGGDIRVRGHPEPGQPWRIGIRHPWE